MSVEFVDTNLIVYAYDSSAGEKHDIARALLTRLWKSGQGALSVQVLQEFYNVATRKIPQPLHPSEARDRIRSLSLWRIIRPTVDDVLASSELSESDKIAFWDALIVRAAQRAGAETLWSEDLQDERDFGGVRVRNLFRVEKPATE